MKYAVRRTNIGGYTVAGKRKKDVVAAAVRKVEYALG